MRADVGVMISASHNPFHDNGIKLFGPDGHKLSDELEVEIEKLVAVRSILKAEMPNEPLYGGVARAARFADFAGATMRAGTKGSSSAAVSNSTRAWAKSLLPPLMLRRSWSKGRKPGKP